MHIPDGFIDGSTSLGAAAVATAGLAVCGRRAGDALDEQRAPLVGLTAAYIFALQMLNFPVAAGTSGHLLGGVLAMVLVGPWAGALCIAVVLTIQALVFADGGLSALGLNVLNMALIGPFVGYGLFVLLRRVAPDTRAGVAGSAGIAAAVGVVAAAVAFVAEYALGGTGGASVTAVLSAMIGVHVLIGVGEGVITALTVAAVLASRPDLVHGAQGRTLRDRPGVTVATTGTAS